MGEKLWDRLISGSEFATEAVEQQTAQEFGNMDRGARQKIERRTFVMPTISCSDEGAEVSNLLMGLEWPGSAIDCERK
jgi:hypothetical protein